MSSFPQNSSRCIVSNIRSSTIRLSANLLATLPLTMSAASRSLVMRVSRVSLRTAPRQLVGPSARRSYASQHSAAKSSDMPWLLASVGITIPGVAYLLSGEKKTEHHDDHSDHSDSQGAQEARADEHGDEKKEDDAPPTNQKPESGNPKAAHKSSQSGKETPPTTTDNRSLSEAWDEKKEGHEQYKETMEKRDTKVATSSSDMPSKKASGEHPSEDPKKGEGEGVQKGSSN